MFNRALTVFAMVLTMFGGAALSAQYSSLSTNLNGNTSTSTGTHMLFDLVTNTNEVKIFEFDHRTTGTPTDVNVYYKVGTWVGSELNASAWTLHANVTVSAPVASFVKVVLPTPLTIPPNSTYGIAIGSPQTSPSYVSSGVSTTGYTSADLHIAPPWRASTGPFTGGIANREWCGTIYYTAAPPGPLLTVAANAGTALPVYSNYQGPGSNGIEAGSFTITSNNQAGAVVTGIDIAASGTGNDAAAFTEVLIYRDDPTLGTPGVYDPADILVSGPSTFPADDGTINFTVATAEQAIPVSETRTYFVVSKMAGVALPNETFMFTVSDILTAAGTFKNVPANSTMNGLVIDTPQFVFADVSNPQAQKVYLTFTGICQEFTITYPAGPDDKPSGINVTGLGTADEAADLVSAQLWWDSDNDGSFNNAVDTLVDSQVYAVDDGIVSYSLASHPDFQPGQTRRYFVVYALNANANDLETFRCFVSDMGSASLGGSAVGLPAPSANGTPGLEVSAAILFGIMNGPLAPVTVSSNWTGATGDGELLADVTLDALPGGDWVVNALNFNAGGTGNHNGAFFELGLYEDSNTNGAWDGASVDTLAAPLLSGYSANTASFDLILTNLLAGTDRRFFMVGKLNGTAATGETFNARLSGLTIGQTPPGGSQSGFPTPASTAMIIDVAALSVANGPNQPNPPTHIAGAPGDAVAANFRIHSLNGPTTVTGLNLTTSGTGDWSTDIDGASGVRVYRDDGDGIFGASDGAALFQGGGAGVVTAGFSPALNLAVGEIADLWVVLGFTATAGQGVAAAPETFSVSITATTDVSASAPVAFGMLAPNGVTVGAIEFNVAGFNPTTAVASGGQAITMTGSGFIAPLLVTIGGTVCPGTPVISGGTQVTGLTVPAGFGTALPIVVHSGDLPPQTLAMTFTYTAPKDTDPPKKDESGCASSGSASWGWLLLAMAGLLAATQVARRRAR